MSSAKHLASQYVKMVKEREVLFDEDRNGIPFFYDYDATNDTGYVSKFSLIGACVSQAFDLLHTPDETVNVTLGDPLMFEPVLSFKSGEELLMYMSFVLKGTDPYKLTNIDLAAIMKVKTT